MLPAIILAATVSCSWTVPAFGDSLISGVCGGLGANKPKYARVRATWDSVYCVASSHPPGQFFRSWSDTLKRRRGDAVFYDHPTSVLDTHLLTVKTFRWSNHWPPEELSVCKPAVILVNPR